MSFVSFASPLSFKSPLSFILSLSLLSSLPIRSPISLTSPFSCTFRDILCVFRSMNVFPPRGLVGTLVKGVPSVGIKPGKSVYL